MAATGDALASLSLGVYVLMWSVYMYLSSLAHLSFLIAIFNLLEVSTNFCDFALKVTTAEFISHLTLGLMAPRCCPVLAHEGRFRCIH